MLLLFFFIFSEMNVNAFDDFEDEAFEEENVEEQRFSYSVSQVTEDDHHHQNPSFVINLNNDDDDSSDDEDDVTEIFSKNPYSENVDFGYSSEEESNFDFSPNLKNSSFEEKTNLQKSPDLEVKEENIPELRYVFNYLIYFLFLFQYFNYF